MIYKLTTSSNPGCSDLSGNVTLLISYFDHLAGLSCRIAQFIMAIITPRFSGKIPAWVTVFAIVFYMIFVQHQTRNLVVKRLGTPIFMAGIAVFIYLGAAFLFTVASPAI